MNKNSNVSTFINNRVKDFMRIESYYITSVRKDSGEMYTQYFISLKRM